jgi:hypothetical protein
MALFNITGLPGTGTPVVAIPKNIFRSLDGMKFAAGGVVLDGNACGDWSNTDHPEVLQAGLILGKLSTSKYAPTILGVLQQAQASTDTSITVSSYQATEIARRIGNSGTLTIAGPPATAGTVASATHNYSAVNTSTGVITMTAALGAALAVGSVVMAADGTQTPVGILPTEFGIRMTDPSNIRLDQPLSHLLISGDLVAAQITGFLNLDPSVQTWVRSALCSYGRTFTFDIDYQ